MARIVIVYHSGYGHTAAQAEAGQIDGPFREAVRRLEILIRFVIILWAAMVALQLQTACNSRLVAKKVLNAQFFGTDR